MPEWFSDIGPIRFRFEGNLSVAYKYIPKARSLALQLRNRLIAMEVDVNQYEHLELEDAVIQVHVYGTQMIAVITGLSQPVEEEPTKEEAEPTKYPILWVGASVQVESLAGQNTDTSSYDTYAYDENFLEHYYDSTYSSHSYKNMAYGSSTVYEPGVVTVGTDNQTQYIPYINIIVCEPDWDSQVPNSKTVMQSIAPIYYDTVRESFLNKFGADLVYVFEEKNQTFNISASVGKKTITGNYGVCSLQSAVDAGIIINAEGPAYSDCAGNSFNAGYTSVFTGTDSVVVNPFAFDWQNPYAIYSESVHIIPPYVYSTTTAYANITSARTPSGMYTLSPIPHTVSDTVQVETSVSLIPKDVVKTLSDIRNTLRINDHKYLTNNILSYPYGMYESSASSETSISYDPTYGPSVTTFVPHNLDTLLGCYPAADPYKTYYGMSHSSSTAIGHAYYFSSSVNTMADIKSFTLAFSHQSPGEIYAGEYKIYILASDQGGYYNAFPNNVTCTVDVYIQLSAKKEPKKFTIDIESIADQADGYYDTSAAGALPGTGNGWYNGHWVVDVKKQTITHVKPPL